jgi:uncharacterized iron-regulated protein
MVYCGTEDPCFDGCARLVEKLSRYGCKAFLYQYLHLTHGQMTLSKQKFYPAILFFNNVENDIWMKFNS